MTARCEFLFSPVDAEAYDTLPTREEGGEFHILVAPLALFKRSGIHSCDAGRTSKSGSLPGLLNIKFGALRGVGICGL